MLLKLKIKKDKHSGRNRMIIWIQRDEAFKKDIQELFKFFNNKIVMSKKRRVIPYFLITSDNPAILLSLFSALLDSIPEIYFKIEEES